MSSKNIIITLGVVMLAAVIGVISWGNMNKPTTIYYGEFPVTAEFIRIVTEGDISPELARGTYALFENNDESFLVDAIDFPTTSTQINDLKSGTEYVIIYQEKIAVKNTVYKQLDWIVSVKEAVELL